jgi:hypothetical protein
VLTPARVADQADSRRQPDREWRRKACRAGVCNGSVIAAANDARIRVTMTDRYDFRLGSLAADAFGADVALGPK